MAAASNQTQAPPTSSNRRTLTGFVTKLVGNDATYGFINDEIFFQQSSVTVGAPANVNDQVYAECEYSAHLPIKWNATCVKVLNRATGSVGNLGPTGSSVSQPQPQTTQMLASMTTTGPSQMVTTTTTDSSQVAVTYQQHRQQRLQRQMLEMQQQQQQPPPLKPQDQNLLGHQQPNQPMLPQQHQQDQQAAGQPDFSFAPSAQMQPEPSHHQPIAQALQQQQQQQPPPQQQDPNLPPAFHDRPMGPPKFAFTNQLGSAFVQSPAQFMPSPFLAQQPPPQMPLAQTQHPSQVGGPNLNNNNQRQKRDGRFNDRGGDKFNNSNNNSNNSSNNTNDNSNRQQNRRMNSSRNNDGGSKFDRDNSARPRTNLSRDRSSGSATKKDDTPTRASPPSSRSRASVSSDRGSRTYKRHYEPTNIPRSRILTDMNSSDMKHRCSSSIHVPSDLKNVLINKHYRLDIKNTPKPIKFKIEPTSQVVKEDQASTQSSVAASSTDKKSSSTETGSDTEQKSKSIEQSQGRSASEVKLYNKYGVKVVLMSLPELEDIYKEVFGQQLDSFTNDQKHQHCLDESIQLLCSKSSSGGNSLIGGKFDPTSDGFIEGASNEFERSGKLPDLIATCKRVVREQTGLDLSSCQSWTHISTFMYNNKSDYFSSKASIEYSYIYMPHIWTMAPDKLETKAEIKSEPSPEKEIPGRVEQPLGDDQLQAKVEPTESVAMDAQESGEQQTPAEVYVAAEAVPEQAASDTTLDPGQSTVESTTKDSVEGSLGVENLADLKVVELKVELDKRGIKYKPNAKKIELVTVLREALASAASNQEAAQLNLSTDQASTLATEHLAISEDAQTVAEGETQQEAAGEANVPQDQQLEEGEVLASKEQSPELAEEDTKMDAEDSGNSATEKRKISSSQDESDTNKKAKLDTSTRSSKVQLIAEPFVVKSQGQQALTLVSLYDANQVSRYDQFELSVTSSIIKESLIQHFSEYILTTLVENDRQKQQSSSTASSGDQQQSSTASSQNSQETNSDTNNNNDSKGAFKNPSNTSSVTAVCDKQSAPIIVKELPVDRYINLAFVYFDSTHIGYLHYDDLIKLFNNTGLNLSKRALVSLIGDNEKFNYRLLPDLSPKLSPTYLYKFPQQFNRLPGESGSTSATDSVASLMEGNSRIEFEGVTYTVEKLINQVREAETMRVNYVTRFNQAIENYDKQAEEIHVLEVSQKSLSKAIKSQNEEICDLKRERDSIKKKYEHLRRGIESTVSSLNALIKDEK